MTAKKPLPGELDAIETASRDEIAALQFERMTWSLQHAYDNVPHYKKSFDEKGIHPSDLKTLADLAKFPLPPKLTCATTTLLGYLPCRAGQFWW
jgi:phenylacetate-CoA ligase